MSSLPTLMSKISLDSTGFENGISKSMNTIDKFNQKMKKVSKDLKASFDTMESIGKKSAIGFGAAIAAVTGLVKASGTAESTMKKLEIATAGNTNALKIMEQQSQRLAKATAYNSIQYKDAMANAYAMGKNYELNATQVSNIVSIAADLGSIYGKDLPDATERLMAAMRGEAEASEALGLSLSQTAVEHWMLSKGIKGTLADMSLAEQAQVRYQMLLDKTKDTIGASEKMTNTFSGAWERLKNTFVEVAASTGNNFLEPVKNVLNKITDFLEIVNQSPALQKFISDALTLGIVIAGIGTIIGILGKMGNLTLSLLTKGFALLTNPITWIVALIAIAVIKVEGFADTWKEAFEEINGIWINPDMTILDKINATLGTVVTAAITAMQKVGLFITEKLGGDVAKYMDATNTAITNIQNALNNLSVSTAETKLQGFVDLVKELFTLPGTFTLSVVVDTEKSALDNLMNIVGAVAALRLMGIKGKTAISIAVGLDAVLGDGWTGDKLLDSAIKSLEIAIATAGIVGPKAAFSIALPVFLVLSGTSFIGDFFAKDIREAIKNAEEGIEYEPNFLQQAFNWSQLEPLFKGFAENFKKVVSKEDMNFFDGLYAAGLGGAISFGYAFHKVIQGAFDIVGWIGEKISEGFTSFVEWGKSIGEGIKQGIDSFFSGVGNWFQELFFPGEKQKIPEAGENTPIFDEKYRMDNYVLPMVKANENFEKLVCKLPEIFQHQIMSLEEYRKTQEGYNAGNNIDNKGPSLFDRLIENTKSNFKDWFRSDDFSANPLEITKGILEKFPKKLGDAFGSIIEKIRKGMEIAYIQKMIDKNGVEFIHEYLKRAFPGESELSIPPNKKGTVISGSESITSEANKTSIEKVIDNLTNSFDEPPNLFSDSMKLMEYNYKKMSELSTENSKHTPEANPTTAPLFTFKEVDSFLKGTYKLTGEIENYFRHQLIENRNSGMKEPGSLFTMKEIELFLNKKGIGYSPGKHTPEANPTTAPLYIPEEANICIKNMIKLAEEIETGLKSPLITIKSYVEKVADSLFKFGNIEHSPNKRNTNFSTYSDTPPANATTAPIEAIKEVEKLTDNLMEINNLIDVNKIEIATKRIVSFASLSDTEKTITENANNTTTAIKDYNEELKNLSVEIPDIIKNTEEMKESTVTNFQIVKETVVKIGEKLKTVFENLWEFINSSPEEKKPQMEIKGIDFGEGFEKKFEINLGIIGKLFDNISQTTAEMLTTLVSRNTLNLDQVSNKNKIVQEFSDGASILVSRALNGINTIVDAVKNGATPNKVEIDNSTITGSISLLSENMDGFLTKTSDLLNNFNTFVQQNTDGNDNIVVSIVREMLSMVTNLVASLAESNRTLSVEMAEIQSQLDKTTNDLLSAEDRTNQVLQNQLGKKSITETVGMKDGVLQGFMQDQLEGLSGKTTALGESTKETTSALDRFKENLMNNIKSIGNTLNPLNIVNGWLGSLTSGLQGLISAIDPIAAIFRGINKALAPVLSRLMKPLEHLGFIVGKALIPVVEALIPVFTGLAYIVAGIWNALASVINFVLGWLGVKIPTINFNDSWENEQKNDTPSEMTNSAGWHQPIQNTYNVTFTGNTLLDDDDESMATLAKKFLQYIKEHEIEVVTG